MYLNSHEAIYKPKKRISLKDLFSPPDIKEKPNHILIEGRAGIGKSTLCQYITYLWATLSDEALKEKLGDWATDFDLLVWIPLRKILDENYTFPKIPENAKVLYILDGYDEVAHLQEKRKALLNSLLDKPFWILTSRPHYFTERDRKNFLHLENIGFEEENVKQYVQTFFTQFEDEKKNATPS